MGEGAKKKRNFSRDYFDFLVLSHEVPSKLSAAQSHREKGITHHRLATFAIIAAMTPPFSVPSMSFSSSRTSRTGLSAVNAKNSIIEGKSKKLLRPTLKKFFVQPQRAAANQNGTTKQARCITSKKNSSRINKTVQCCEPGRKRRLCLSQTSPSSATKSCKK